MKIAINARYGGFSISHEAVLRYWEIKGEPIYFTDESSNITHYCTEDVDTSNYRAMNDSRWLPKNIERTDPILHQVIDELGNKANGVRANLKIVDIPDDVQWTIEEYDGFEHIEESHRVWG